MASHTVTNHYNQRPNASRDVRAQSAIRQLRGFNNWVKSVLIRQVTQGKQALAVLDLCGGKGGDLGKWDRANIEKYTLVDVAATSVKHARERYAAQRYRFQAIFAVADAFAPKLPVNGLFDVVSCQFALHYSFETQARAEQLFKTVARLLKPGGAFIGTIPDWRVLTAKRKQHGERFGNSVYTIAFDKATGTSPYGQRYTFTLQDAIDACPEYTVPMHTLKTLAASVGLKLELVLNFHQVYTRFSQGARALMQRMGCFDARGQLPAEQWAVAELYLAFVFRKG